MLSHEDRRRLAAIEQQIQIDDPAFARLFTGRPVAACTWWRRATAVVVGMLGALVVLAGLLTAGPLLVVSGAVMLAGAWWLTHRTRPLAG